MNKVIIKGNNIWNINGVDVDTLDYNVENSMSERKTTEERDKEFKRICEDLKDE